MRLRPARPLGRLTSPPVCLKSAGVVSYAVPSATSLAVGKSLFSSRPDFLPGFRLPQARRAALPMPPMPCPDPMATLGTLPPRVGIGCCSWAMPSGDGAAGLAQGEEVAELVAVGGGLGDVLCFDDGTVVSFDERSLE